jgi:hypothetical protein
VAAVPSGLSLTPPIIMIIIIIIIKCIVEMSSSGMIYISGFMKTGAGIERILRFCLCNLQDSNVGSTAGRNLLSGPLKWTQAA